ncbi:MAG: acyltransferase family protein [Lachnospiraceae bacterium]|jgi:Acyltransferase family.|nr:acyltransferase family protein [Lachnospiraceae bacterium]
MLCKEDTKKLKGIAILLMLAHHLYTFADRIPYEMHIATSIHISGQELTVIIGLFGKICVSLYMFLGGYGLYASCIFCNHQGQLQIKNSLYRKIINLYTAYWKIFLIYIPIGYLLFSNQPQFCNTVTQHTRFAAFSLHKIISDFFAITNLFNSEWWFLRTYLFVLFEGFVFIELLKNKKNIHLECCFIILWNILITQIFPSFTSIPFLEELDSNIWYKNLFLINEYASLFFIGIIFAKYKIFMSWNQLFDSCKRFEKIILSLFVIISCVYVRVFIMPVSFDLLLVPIFIFACHIFVEETIFLNKLLLILGRHSTNIWLTHSFYCYYFYFFVRIVYGSRNAVISMIVLISLSLGSSILINLLWQKIGLFYNHIISHTP